MMDPIAYLSMAISATEGGDDDEDEELFQDSFHRSNSVGARLSDEGIDAGFTVYSATRWYLS